jgi:predicted membrane-bound spermidine synthase
MDIKKIIKESMDDFEWIRQVEPNFGDLILNKALYFDPDKKTSIKNNYEEYYDKIVNHLINDGFVSKHNTPTYFREDIIGLYIYIGKTDNQKYFVFTTKSYHGDTIKSYKEHIQQYAKSNSGQDVDVVDATHFVKTFFNII